MNFICFFEALGISGDKAQNVLLGNTVQRIKVLITEIKKTTTTKVLGRTETIELTQ